MEKFKQQDYGQLKRQQLARDVKFVDETFPIESVDLQAFSSVDLADSVDWKRPDEIREAPSLIGTTLTNYSSSQLDALKKGFVGNVNIALAFTSLTLVPRIWNQVIPNFKQQNWLAGEDRVKHPGIFRFRFWFEGSAVEVVIDDRLPVLDDKFICMLSLDGGFWPALLEKAYAKLLGGYQQLEHVRLEDILIDLTGGVTEVAALMTLVGAQPMQRVQFYESIQESFQDNSIVIFCTNTAVQEQGADGDQSTPPSPTHLLVSSSISSSHTSPSDLTGPRLMGSVDKQTGLCHGYGYLLTRLSILPQDATVFGAIKSALLRQTDNPVKARLLRLRCPLIGGVGASGLGEWIGPYSTRSSEWEEIDQSVKRRFNLTFDTNADFWIPLDELLRHASAVVVCRMPNTSAISLSGRNTWQLAEYHGAWHGYLSGGGFQHRDTFMQNPQYIFDIEGADGGEILISLIRKLERDSTTGEIPCLSLDDNSEAMGFGLFQVECNRATRVHRLEFVRTIHIETARPCRTASLRQHLNPGRYLVIPYLEQPKASSQYLLRLFLPKRSPTRELVLDIIPSTFGDMFYGPPRQALRLVIHNAVNLTRPDVKSPPNPYCRITSEDGTTRTTVATGTTSPFWGQSFIFFRRRPKKVPVVVEIFDRHALGTDIFLGRFTFNEATIATCPSGTLQELSLYGRDTKAERGIQMKGSLFVEVYSITDNLTTQT